MKKYEKITKKRLRLQRKKIYKLARNKIVEFLAARGKRPPLDYRCVVQACESFLNITPEDNSISEANIRARLRFLYTKITSKEFPFVEPVKLENSSKKVRISPKPEYKKGKVDFSSATNDRIEQFYKSYEWRKLRYTILKKFGSRCMCCGYIGKNINVDHIKPLRIYWSLRLDPDNLQILCHECNHGKGNWDETDWRSERVAEINIQNELVGYFDQWHFWDSLDQNLRSELVYGIVDILNLTK